MRAIGIGAFGDPDVLELLDLPIPDAQANEVRIRVHAASINRGDVAFRAGGGLARFLGDRPPPYVLGLEVAGVVDEIGPDVDARLTVGEPVVAFVNPMARWAGGYADFVVTPAASVVRAPANATQAEAATLLVNATTARLALDLLDMARGATLAVTGAAGAVGGYAIQMAKADGLRVIADASPSDAALIRSLGADFVVARGDSIAQEIRERIPIGVDGLIDAAGLGGVLLPAIRDGGGLAAVQPWEAPLEREIVVHQVNSMTRLVDPAELERLIRYVEDDVLTLRVADVVAPADVVAAHRRLEAGGVRGRLVLDFAAGDAR